MALEGMANFHSQRVTLHRQALVLAVFAFITLVSAIAFVGIQSSSFYYTSGDMIWMFIVAFLSLLGLGYFLQTQKENARSPDFAPQMPHLVTGVVLALLWFTCAVAGSAGYSFYYCTVSSLYNSYASSYSSSYYSSYSSVYNHEAGLITGLCITGVVADIFGWLAFIGFVIFALTTYGLGSRAGGWGGVSQTVQMGAMPALAQPTPGGPAYGAQPYGQGPQGAYPQQPQDVYSPQAAPQPFTPQMTGQQLPYSPQMQPYSPPVLPYGGQPQSHLYGDAKPEGP